MLLQDQKTIHRDQSAPLHTVAGTPPPPPHSWLEGNIYFQQSSQAELTIAKNKGATANDDVKMKTDPKTGIRYLYNREYDYSEDYLLDSKDAIFVEENTTFTKRMFPKAIKNKHI